MMALLSPLSNPHYTFNSLSFGPLNENTKHSGRVAPAVFGLGLLRQLRKRSF